MGSPPRSVCPCWWGLVDIRQARKAVVTRILEGDGKASPALRRAAFNNTGLAKPLHTLIDKVARHAYRVTDEDIAAARAAGLSQGTLEQERSLDPETATMRLSFVRAC